MGHTRVQRHFPTESISNTRCARRNETLNSSKKLTCPKSNGTESERVQAKTSFTGSNPPTRASARSARASCVARLPVSLTRVVCASHTAPRRMPNEYGSTFTVAPESISPWICASSPPLKLNERGSIGMRNESPRPADTGRNGNCSVTAQRDVDSSRRYCDSVFAASTASWGDQTGYAPAVKLALSSWASSAVRNCTARNFSARGSRCSSGRISASFMTALVYLQPPTWQVSA